MRSGDQVLFEAVIRSLPARRRRDEELRALGALAPAMQAIAQSFATTARAAAEAMRPIAAAFAEIDRAGRDAVVDELQRDAEARRRRDAGLE